ncbi:Headcase protein [Popillia japonica]|uniref:Headcase protein n=1 Tax=Popillia japonica TaxID=7064 RepID=A0AAW1MDJ6_POPJA
MEKKRLKKIGSETGVRCTSVRIIKRYKLDSPDCTGGKTERTTPPDRATEEMEKKRLKKIGSETGVRCKRTTPPDRATEEMEKKRLKKIGSETGVRCTSIPKIALTPVLFFNFRSVAGGANGIFTRRLDFSSFNALPKNKLNSYQIKTEDEGNHGNDDTRCFILSTLASQGRSRVHCVLCEDQLLVFDRYPLVDGTFFLSPRQHAKSCIEVKVEGRTQFLSVVCMGCLEGASGRAIRCRFCNQHWDGTSLVLGTMYSYDIFAAMPCCTERIKCNACYKPVLHPSQRLNFFSDYSHMVPCPHCRTLDTHFVKPLSFCYARLPLRSLQMWP